MTNLITQHLDTWTTAPNGIKKLRELILELAVRGLLVPQNPDDEPASVLLENIAEGKIKNSELLSKTNNKKIPFTLPKGWESISLGVIAEIERGGSPRPIKSFLTDDPDGFNWIKIGDTEKNGKYITSTSEKICKEGLSKTRMVFPGDFLLTNSMSFGRPYITQITGCIHDGWLRISPPNCLDKDYLYLFLSSPVVRKLFEIEAAGAVVLNLNAEKVRYLPILIPPLAEQHRIVTKVDELMQLCDQLEQKQTSNQEIHAQLVSTLLTTLTQATDPQAFQAAWTRIAANFDSLFTTESSIEQLKQTILQLAVMGKLVEQEAGDEPASVLLEKIAHEKARLISEGKIKKSAPLPKIADDEKPFDLPTGWEWTRLGEVLNVLNGRAYKKHEMLQEGTPLLRVGNLFTSNHWYYSDLELEPDKYIDNGDLIYAWSASFGAFIWQGEKVIYHYHIWKLDIFHPEVTNKHFLSKFLTSITQQIKDAGNGIAMIHMTKERMEKLLLPLPPSEEQHRIVAKVDELMALCDQLKTKLNTAQTLQIQLAETLVLGAVG
jgi:type I restriction enzyme S subunit